MQHDGLATMWLDSRDTYCLLLNNISFGTTLPSASPDGVMGLTYGNINTPSLGMHQFSSAHSAGAQFLSRMMAFRDSDAERLIVMSPGSVIFPTRDLDFELGFGGLHEAFSSDERLRRYLALPITVAVGSVCIWCPKRIAIAIE